MGKKMSAETAQRFCAIKNDNSSIFCPQNKYGYKVNINHPKILPLYERYKQKVKEKILSDKQRFEFEAIIFGMLERKKNEQTDTSREADS